jgi:hypothetical protein
MCFKSRGQKEAEKNTLQAQQNQMQGQGQELKANDMQLAIKNALMDIFKERQASEDAYYGREVDPYLNSLKSEGFYPGEERRLMNQANESIGRSFQNEEGALRRAYSDAGFGSETPSGTLTAGMGQLSRARMETGVNARRSIQDLGVQRRMAGLGLSMDRARAFNPMGYGGMASGTNPGNIGGVQQAQLAPSTWQSIAPLISASIGATGAAFVPVPKLPAPRSASASAPQTFNI